MISGVAGAESTQTGRKKHGARVRTCAGCGRKRDKTEMLRIVRTPEGEVLPDPVEKKDGRGVYLCFETGCMEKAQKRKSIERALKKEVPKEFFIRLREVIESHGTE